MNIFKSLAVIGLILLIGMGSTIFIANINSIKQQQMFLATQLKVLQNSVFALESNQQQTSARLMDTQYLDTPRQNNISDEGANIDQLEKMIAALNQKVFDLENQLFESANSNAELVAQDLQSQPEQIETELGAEEKCQVLLDLAAQISKNKGLCYTLERFVEAGRKLFWIG